MSNDQPKLRFLDIQPVNVEGQQLVRLHDPQGYAPDACFVRLQDFLVIRLLDGQHSIVDIQADYMKRTGQLLMSDDVRQIIDELDAHRMLDSESFAEFKAGVEEEFRAAPVREPCSAGGGYPEEPAEIRASFDEYLAAAQPSTSPRTPRGLIAPHVDFHRGGAGYGHAYATLAETDVRLFIVLGIAHAPTETPFIASTKAFQTPLGVAQTDGDLVGRLAQESGLDLFHDEWAHKAEHSIEFQAVFLQHLFGDDFRMVPVLCSSLDPFTPAGATPSDSEPLAAFFDALRGVIAEAGEPIGVIAGVDLAHVGPQFGDPDLLTESRMESVERADSKMLDHVIARDAGAFYKQVQSDNNARNICGLSAIYTLLVTQDLKEARLIHYGQAVDEQKVCGVTFASGVFY